MQAIGEQNLMAWWEKLKLTSVVQWVSVALLLTGIAIVAFAAATANLPLLLIGAGILGFGIAASLTDGHLKSWIETLGLNKVAGWVSISLMLAGMALIAFGAMTMNVVMLLAGIAASCWRHCGRHDYKTVPKLGGNTALERSRRMGFYGDASVGNCAGRYWRNDTKCSDAACRCGFAWRRSCAKGQ